MKKIFVLAVIIVIIGVLCALLFNNGKTEPEINPDEKPWTVGDSIELLTEESTDAIIFDDAVMCFSNFINTELREKYSFIEETKVVTTDDLASSVVGLYVYDVDSDAVDELSVIYTNEGVFCLDIYEFVDGTARLSATTELSLDSMDSKLFTTDLTSDSNIAARVSIFPNGKERAFCLTCELAESDIGYNAYTVVYEYKDGVITLKNNFRLRSLNNTLSLTDTVNSTPIYTVTGSDIPDTADTTEAINSSSSEEVTVESDFDSLTDAFNNTFDSIGLKAPDISVNGSALSRYKVTPVENEQKVLEFSGGNNEVMFSENGFLHSFILDV